MTTAETAEALAAWAGEVCAIDDTHDHEPKERTESLPDAWAITKSVAYADAPEQQIQQVEQARYKLSQFAVMLFVEPEPADDAADALNAYCDALGAAADADRTLGDRVENIAPGWDFDFHLDAPFAELSDGTRARRLTMNLIVVESLST